MKTLIALIATVAASSAFAASTQDFGCYELRAKLNRNGILILDGKRYVAEQGRGDYCNSGEQIMTKWVKSADFKNCPIQECVSKSKRNGGSLIN